MIRSAAHLVGLFLIISLFTSFSPSRETVRWYSMQEALDLSARQPRKIMVDVYTPWCGWCKRMDKETFSNPVVAQYMNENFYCVKFNAEGNDTVVFGGRKFVNPQYGRKQRAVHQWAVVLLQGTMSYPSYVFMDEKNKGISIFRGYRKVNQWLPILRWVAKNKYKIQSYDDYYREEEAE